MNIKKFAHFPGVANRDLVGIDLSSNNLKLVHVRVSLNKKELVNILSRSISGLSEDAIAKVINTSFNELRVKNQGIINVIPSHLVITKNIEIPSVDQQEIKEIINLQAGRHTPYSREDIIVGYIEIGTYKNSYTKVLLVIVSRNIIKRQFEILHKAGLKLEKVLLASEGVAWSVANMLKLKTEDLPINVIDLDESFTDFVIVFRDRPIFIRSIPIGTQHLMREKELYQLKLAEELKSSLEAYQSEDIEKSPNTAVLTGAVEDLPDLEKVLNDALYLPARRIPYFRNVSISEDILKATSTERRRSSFLSVVASLFALDGMKIDLIPEEIKLRKALEERGRDLIKTGILILTIFVLIFSLLISKIYFNNAYLKKLDTKYQSLSQEAGGLENDFSKVSLIRNYLSGRGYSLEVLTELYNVTPEDVELGDIRFDAQGKFAIRGTAESMSTVFSFVDNMEKSKYFKEVKTKYTSKRKEGSKDLTDFEITCLLQKQGDQKE
jgi:type IV pilus assembly protein PilM